MTPQWPRWRLKSPASRLFTQSFIQTQIKENSKAPRHRPLCWEFTGPVPVNSPHEGPVRRQMFPFDDVIMTERHPNNKHTLPELINLGIVRTNTYIKLLLWVTLTHGTNLCGRVCACVQFFNEAHNKPSQILWTTVLLLWRLSYTVYWPKMLWWLLLNISSIPTDAI